RVYMLNIATEKIKPIYRVNMDTPTAEWQNYIKEGIPFLFLEKNEHLYAYVETIGLEENISFEDLKNKAISIDLVGVLKNREYISMPFYFYIHGYYLSIIKICYIY